MAWKRGYMYQAQALYQLQTLETQLDTAKARITEIAAQLKDDERVKAAHSELKTRHRAFQQAEGRANDLELELAALTEKITENDELLYSGKITNPRELQERQQELESLRNRQRKLEADLADAQQNLSITHSNRQEADEMLKLLQAEVASQNQDLVHEEERLRARMTEWLDQRKQALQLLEEKNQKLYKRLKSQKNGVAVIRLRGDICSFCQIEQTQTTLYQIRHAKELVYCESCGRLLVDI